MQTTASQKRWPMQPFKRHQSSVLVLNSSASSESATVTVNNSTQLVCNVSTVYRHKQPGQFLNYQECQHHASMLENWSQEYVHVKRFVLHMTSSDS